MDVGGLDTPVLVVGAGPVGAILALELARHDVPSIVLEQTVRPPRHPKIDYLNGRSMELLRRLGIADTIRASGIGADYSTDFLWTQGFDRPPVLVWHHPSVNQMRARFATVNDGTAPLEPYQRVQGPLLEANLRDAIREHPLIDLREGWTFSDLQLDEGSVTATVIERDTGEAHAVRARYLAACDGSHSTVRRCLEIPVQERGAPTHHCSVYFRSRDAALRQHGRAFVTISAKGLTLVSCDEADAWTGSVLIPPDEPITADMVALMRERLGVGFAVDEVLSVTHWKGSLAVATSYQRGRAFLVGDAAHQFYPVGGHGANTGIGDAVDLGWKLAASIKGWGGPLLLASYEQERRPVARFNRELCANLVDVWQRFARLDEAGAGGEHIAGVLEQDIHQIDNLGVHFGYRYDTSPVIWHEKGHPPTWHWRHITPTTWPGGRAPAVHLADGTQLFDRFAVGFTLVDTSGCDAGEPLVRAARRRGIPMSHLPLDDSAVRACWERDLVLVRPDQHVAWRDDTAPYDCDAVLDRVTGCENT